MVPLGNECPASGDTDDSLRVRSDERIRPAVADYRRVADVGDRSIVLETHIRQSVPSSRRYLWRERTAHCRVSYTVKISLIDAIDMDALEDRMGLDKAQRHGEEHGRREHVQ